MRIRDGKNSDPGSGTVPRCLYTVYGIVPILSSDANFSRFRTVTSRYYIPVQFIIRVDSDPVREYRISRKKLNLN